jgi:hypothetical protein
MVGVIDARGPETAPERWDAPLHRLPQNSQKATRVVSPPNSATAAPDLKYFVPLPSLPASDLKVKTSTFPFPLFPLVVLCLQVNLGLAQFCCLAIVNIMKPRLHVV